MPRQLELPGCVGPRACEQRAQGVPPPPAGLLPTEGGATGTAIRIQDSACWRASRSQRLRGQGRRVPLLRGILRPKKVLAATLRFPTQQQARL